MASPAGLAVPGIRGSELTAQMRARLPACAPAAPWSLSATALVWLAPATRAAIGARQPGVRGRPLAVGGMFVSYSNTPVGPYQEVIGVLLLRDGLRVAVHIPFIAVDSPASVVGGRANWSLPKTLAQFSGDLLHECGAGVGCAGEGGASHAAHQGGASHAARQARAHHPDWQVRARARAMPGALPLALRFALAQAAADGGLRRARGRARVRLSPAVVRVHTSGPPELTSWLRSGIYPGALVARFDGQLDASR